MLKYVVSLVFVFFSCPSLAELCKDKFATHKLYEKAASLLGIKSKNKQENPLTANQKDLYDALYEKEFVYRPDLLELRDAGISYKDIKKLVKDKKLRKQNRKLINIYLTQIDEALKLINQTEDPSPQQMSDMVNIFLVWRDQDMESVSISLKRTGLSLDQAISLKEKYWRDIEFYSSSYLTWKRGAQIYLNEVNLTGVKNHYLQYIENKEQTGISFTPDQQKALSELQQVISYDNITNIITSGLSYYHLNTLMLYDVITTSRKKRKKIKEIITQHENDNLSFFWQKGNLTLQSTL